MRWLVAWLLRRAATLRFPVLFAITTLLFVLTLVIPDAIPFADELLLGLGALLLAGIRKPSAPSGPEPAAPPGSEPPDRRAAGDPPR